MSIINMLHFSMKKFFSRKFFHLKKKPFPGSSFGKQKILRRSFFIKYCTLTQTNYIYSEKNFFLELLLLSQQEFFWVYSAFICKQGFLLRMYNFY